MTRSLTKHYVVTEAASIKRAAEAADAQGRRMTEGRSGSVGGAP